MDLLKDNNYVPETDQYNSPILQDIEDVFGNFADLIIANTTDYGFMELLNDKGYIPSNDFWLPKPSNDNDIILKLAS
jgi:hypothetical protein